jgi:RNA polymerase sigma-70 factor (ECF subfamily)
MNSMTSIGLPHARVDEAKAAWQRFVETFEPLRPELYRYCRFLTRNAWDAEDLVQDALARALVTLGCLFQQVENPRAWLFRVASNLWIDRQRRAREETGREVSAAAPRSDRLSVEGREAAAALIGQLAPQERAAVLLKDVFDFTIEETAVILTTTPGAVKSALHRGRGKLAEAEPHEPTAVAAPVIDAFCEAFNAHDLDRLVALLLDTATAEIVGIATEYGPEKMKRSDTGSLYHTLCSTLSHAVAAEFLSGYSGGVARAEKADYRGEPILTVWYEHDQGSAVRDVVRLAVEADRIASIRFHFFSPDVIADVCAELGLPWRSNGYRYWPASV